MNPFLKVETLCASAVERVFGMAFPSPLQPVQVARKLVAVFETAGAGGRGGCRLIVGVHPADYERFQGDKGYLERQWSTMLARLAERSQKPQRSPEVVLEATRSLARGTLNVTVEPLAAPLHLALRVRKGIPPGRRLALRDTLTIGRDADCDLVLADPRVSRKHLKIVAEPNAVTFADLGAANGVLLNGKRSAEGQLDCGDVLILGDSELVVEADESEAV
ncbi:MAG: DUF3662 domain-containing protein [Candidatus Eremiobacteraeota bacterium]|nr:DUF3662 domain-containing protein [Candidatus Eremiobacteraeota bacterium]